MNYLEIYKSGELLKRVEKAYNRLTSCDLCPHNCGVNRLKGEKGLCCGGAQPRIASANIHRGEEPPISGTRGSGTIFFSGCSLKCRFCQNFPISHMGNGENISTGNLAEKMVKLQNLGAHNINFVTPTHFMPQILAALYLAIPMDFRIPIVWNSSGYEKKDVLRLLDGIVDIYLPDMKYADNEIALRLSSATGYMETNRLAVIEMLRQVGHLQLDDDGIAKKGLIIRHLVLPDGLSGTSKVLKWIAEKLGTKTHVSLMRQYFPAHLAHETPGIERKISEEEYDEALEALYESGLDNGWVQD